MGITIAAEKIQRGDSVNYLVYRIGFQKIRTQKAQIGKDRLQTLNDFQRLLGDTSSLRLAVGITPNLIVHLNKTLDGDKDLNSPRELTAEAEKELTIVEEKLQETHVDRVNPNLSCILVILPSRISPTGILMQRDVIILEGIFLSHNPSKKLKTDVEKVSELIIKGKLRLCLLADIDPAEIIMPFTTEEIKKLWEDNEPWQRVCVNFWEKLIETIPKAIDLTL